MQSANLVEDLFDKNYQFEACILCTYGLNLHFFENYLMKLSGLYSCDTVSIFTDSSTYDSFITESYQPRWLNKKYLVTRIKTGGVFHPKLYMFAAAKKALIGVGSANLTRDGIASNLELLSVFEVSESNTIFAPLLNDCITYARSLAQKAKSKKADAQIEEFVNVCGHYLHGDTSQTIRFVHNLEKPLLGAIKEYLQDTSITKIQVVSPFYDTDLTPYRELRKMYPDSKFEMYLQQKKSNFPRELFSEIKSKASLLLYKNIDRYMHGKAILFHTVDSVYLFTGSANFTRSALCLTPPAGNYEIGLLGVISKKTAAQLLDPAGKKAVLVKKPEEIEVAKRD